MPDYFPTSGYIPDMDAAYNEVQKGNEIPSIIVLTHPTLGVVEVTPMRVLIYGEVATDSQIKELKEWVTGTLTRLLKANQL